ncbi:MAG: outer membrane protein assembly factor BamD [Verrucomicrobia bacterium]|nr:MAG: outer membrane protein assembly factor BamD [Verrucomicrobiota bacterium]
MLCGMTQRFIFPLLCGAAGLLMLACSPSTDLPLMTANNPQASVEGEVLFQQAKQAEASGHTKRAIKRYDQAASDFPFAPCAPQARFRQAQLLEQSDQSLEAFEAYQKFLVRFQASNLYSAALTSQAKIAHAAADGSIKKNFLGLHSRLATEKIAEMLGQVRDNAPKTPTAARAQFTIGQIYQDEHDVAKSIAAYRQLVRDQPDCSEAPEALFRVGVVLTEDANRGNRNQATLDLAREAYNDYLTQYPSHHRSAEARQLLANLGSRELQGSFNIAEYYYKIHQFKSAKVYYRDVLKRAPSGHLHEASRARLKELGE